MERKGEVPKVFVKLEILSLGSIIHKEMLDQTMTAHLGCPQDLKEKIWSPARLISSRQSHQDYRERSMKNHHHHC